MVQGRLAPAEAGYAGGANRVRLFEGRLVPSANHQHLNPKLLIHLRFGLYQKCTPTPFVYHGMVLFQLGKTQEFSHFDEGTNETSGDDDP